MDMKLTLVGSDGGKVFLIDTIEHEGALWLVPEWVEVIDPPGQEPKRAIRLTGLDYEPSANPDADFALKTTVSIGILDGTTRPEEADGFLVVDRPDDNRLASKRPI